MDSAEREENGDSLLVDVNENEQAAYRRKSYVALEDRSSGLGKGSPAEDGRRPGGVSGGRVCVASSGRNVNKDGCASLRCGAPVMPGLVAAENKCLPGRLRDGHVISELCVGHGVLNGFTLSPSQDQRTMAGLDLAEGGAEGGGLAGSGRGTTAVSCPAVVGEGNGLLLPLDRVSQTDRDTRRDVARESGRETLDSESVKQEDKTTAEDVPASLPFRPLSCTGIHQRNCAGTLAFSVVHAEIPNGDIDSLESRSPDVDVAYCKAKDMLSSQGSCYDGVDCEDVKVPNGGLHIVNTRATCDYPELDYCGGNQTNFHFDQVFQRKQENNPGLGSGSCGRSQSNNSSSCGGLASGCPGEHAATAAELSPSASKASDVTKCHLTPGSSAKLPSPCPSSFSNLTADSPLTEPSIRGDEEDVTDFSLPARPQTLRTNSNIPVSLSCDATPLSPEDGGFYFGGEGCADEIRSALDVGRRQSAPDTLPEPAEPLDPSDQKLMPKRFGIADFFTRSLFSRKAKEPKAPTQNASGWRLFGKTAARENELIKDAAFSVQQEDQVKGSGVASCPQRLLAAGRRRNLEFEPLSTTALILEDRPANLPAKSLEEAQRHKLEYEEMVAGAKRREVKEAQKKKRQMKERLRQEESISHAMVIWNNEILPHWETMKGTRRVRDLWWQGLPPSVRGTVWSLAIGNELNITPELYEIFLSRAKEKWRSYSETSSVNDSESDCGASLADRESSLDLIKLDISRTFPSLFIFQKGGPYHDLLHSVLGAYTCYRPDIGYVQGMSFIAAVLILNLEEADAFITFANLLNKPCQMAFFRVDHELMMKYFAAFEVFFEENLPRLSNHFQTNNLTPDLYLIDWCFQH
ncbi:TBC1 domain family member 12-like isoform X2 [Lampris incognitus]|uniref:TBC1 domain family member 12-like isoform X2 n=1 Tax=Lampris incognitus TaxID=2546036 RepID=UPI0024B53B28|nr:TBC1 domain family member 12-like isoform X2 [Lampris incognitus]